MQLAEPGGIRERTSQTAFIQTTGVSSNVRIWRGLHSILEPFPASTAAVGVFDGIHRGHQALIRAAVEEARGRRPVVVLTFDRHPAELISPEKAPDYLTTTAQRERLIAQLGVDELVFARFNERFRHLSAEAFLHFVIRGVLGAQTLFVGYDFRFGLDQEGDTAYLLDAQARLGFTARIMSPVVSGGDVASSSRIRELIREGRVEEAAEMLGRPFALVGRVVEGQKLGRTLGFPTANLQPERKQVIPADGIYAVVVTDGSEQWMGACSIGFRPAVGGASRTVEVFLLDFEGDLYGRELEVSFIARLREERNFDSLQALTDQIARDVEQTRQILSRATEGG